jgi:hypothetical protein
MLSKKISHVSPTEMADINAALKTSFDTFAQGNPNGINQEQLVAWAQDRGIAGGALPASTVSLIFSSVKLGKKKELKFDRFQVRTAAPPPPSQSRTQRAPNAAARR